MVEPQSLHLVCPESPASCHEPASLLVGVLMNLRRKFFGLFQVCRSADPVATLEQPGSSNRLVAVGAVRLSCNAVGQGRQPSCSFIRVKLKRKLDAARKTIHTAHLWLCDVGCASNRSGRQRFRQGLHVSQSSKCLKGKTKHSDCLSIQDNRLSTTQSWRALFATAKTAAQRQGEQQQRQRAAVTISNERQATTTTNLECLGAVFASSVSACAQISEFTLFKHPIGVAKLFEKKITWCWWWFQDIYLCITCA